MSKINDNINQNIISILTTPAANHEMSVKSANKLSKPLFEYYDSNSNNVLQKEELEKLKQDLQSILSANGQRGVNKADIQKYLENISSDKLLSVKNLDSFINDILNNYETYIQNEADGEIEHFEQGRRGDCWLLSQLNSLSQTSWGRDAIKNSVVKNKDTNSYTIKFAGVDFETTITQKDIQKARKSYKYSYGDLDVLMFEIATEKYFLQERNKMHIDDKEDVFDDNLSVGHKTMQYLLTGKTGHSFYINNMSEDDHKSMIESICNIDKNYKNILEQIKQHISNAYNQDTMEALINKIASDKECAILCTFPNTEQMDNKQVYKIKNKNDLLKMAGHECSVKNITKDVDGNITDIEIINPWDSEDPVHMTLKEFLDKIDCITVINKDDRYESLKTGFKPCITVK